MKAGTRNSVTNYNGFTLLELMVALSIFSIMGLSAYRLLSGETLVQTHLEDHSAELQQWQRGVGRLTADLRQIAPRSVRIEYGDTEPALYGTSETLTLTRYGWENPLRKARSQLQRVEFGLTSTEDHLTFLQRSVWPVLDRAPDSRPLNQNILPRVSDVQWQYMDADKQWLNHWPPNNTSDNSPPSPQLLPLAIQVTLQSQNFGEISRLIVLKAWHEEDNQ